MLFSAVLGRRGFSNPLTLFAIPQVALNHHARLKDLAMNGSLCMRMKPFRPETHPACKIEGVLPGAAEGEMILPVESILKNSWYRGESSELPHAGAWQPLMR